MTAFSVNLIRQRAGSPARQPRWGALVAALEGATSRADYKALTSQRTPKRALGELARA